MKALINIGFFLLSFFCLFFVSAVNCHSMLHGSSGKNGETFPNTIEETTRTGPYIDKSASKNVTALLGKTTYLNCRVKNLSNKTVSVKRILPPNFQQVLQMVSYTMDVSIRLFTLLDLLSLST